MRTAARNLLVVAVLAVGVIASIYFWRQHGDSVNRTAIASNRAEAAVLNFEDGSELRGAGSQRDTGTNPNSSVQHLPRNVLSLTVYLPLGSPAGEYELDISSGPSETIWSARGIAKINDGLTAIQVNGDLREVQPGEYRFKFRRPGETWHEKNILVR